MKLHKTEYFITRVLYILGMVRLFRLIILLLLLGATAFSQGIRTEPHNFWKSNVLIENTLTTSELIEFSLAASGVVENDFTYYLHKYNQLLIKLQSSLDSTFNSLSSYEKGEYILNWTHENILKRYVEEQTLMDVMIDTGNYNCVSSSVLYLILSREVGLRSRTIETSDHAFCIVETDTGWIDVETTTPYGFEPGIKKEFILEFNKTGFSYVPPGNYRSRSIISDRETIALILQNRISVLQKKGFHDQVVGLAIDRWTLSGTDSSFNDLYDSFNNWSAVLTKRREYKEAFDFILSVLEKYEILEGNTQILYNLANNYVISLINKSEHEEAEDFTNNISGFLHAQDFNELKVMITRDRLSKLVRTSAYDESLPLVREAYQNHEIKLSEWKNWITALHQKKAASIADHSGWLNAWQFLESLPADERQLTGINNSIRQARENWAIDIHNEFAKLFNSEEYEKARQLLIDGLVNDPGNKYLSKDLSDFNRMTP